MVSETLTKTGIIDLTQYVLVPSSRSDTTPPTIGGYVSAIDRYLVDSTAQQPQPGNNLCILLIFELDKILRV